MPLAIAIHGGAGLIRRDALTPEREAACTASLRLVVALGHRQLAEGASALDAAVAAVVALEDNPLFNAGKGSVLTSAGTVEMDAAVMEGARRDAGAVAAVRTVRNPILLARRVMLDTPHVLLVGSAADALAAELGLVVEDPAYFVVAERQAQQLHARAAGGFHLDHGSDDPDVYGTVGCVACDVRGHVAAATSTGGMVNQRPGRVGDTPVIGAGTFAWDATCAVSGTGHGEPFIRLGVAARVSARMELAHEDLATAAQHVIEELGVLEGQGGLVAVDASGRVALPFNTAGMFRAWQQADGEPHVAIW